MNTKLGYSVTKNLMLNGNPIVNSSVITKKSILADIGGLMKQR